LGICVEHEDGVSLQVKKLGKLFPAIGKYQLVALGGIIINLALLFVFTTFFDIFYIVSELIAIILTFGFVTQRASDSCGSTTSLAKAKREHLAKLQMPRKSNDQVKGSIRVIGPLRYLRSIGSSGEMSTRAVR